MKYVNIYTDGSCLGNPGKGGYAAILTFESHRKEIYQGYELTTNNRMELLACIEGLSALKYQCEVKIHCDSKYVVDGISKGWAAKWRNNNWKLSSKKTAENIDLWKRLLELTEYHKTHFIWVKGHAGHEENERCDLLAKEAALADNLERDLGYLENK